MNKWEILELLAMLFVYTATVLFAGAYIQRKYDQYQLKGFEVQAWRDGCNACKEFEQNACERDQLQGVRSEPEVIK